MSAPRRRTKLLLCALALLGLWYAGSALVGLVKTAIFVHNAVVVEATVTNMRQKPFDSWSETLGAGHLSWPGDVAYMPIVRFQMPDGRQLFNQQLPPDNINYANGQNVTVIMPPDAPGTARLYRWKTLWGADSLRLLAGAILLLPGWLALRRHRRAHAPAKKDRPASPKADAPRKCRTAPTGEAKAAPARKPRSRKKTGDSTTPAPRRRKPRAKAADKA